jgi:formylglycine-generating enzyme required for sulfatase activity/tRNA A-37 threonylcarbamoyl transferase component Bud32
MTSEESGPDSHALAIRLQAALGEGYVVERELGAGGFAVVYLVLDVALKRRLAVKVVSPELISSKTVMERFKREAETVAQLSHPNIVPLHFIGQQGDLLYLAMGFIDGGALDARISDVAGQQMSFDAVRRAMSEVASALAHAHKRGVIHRDIKPQNVLIDSESGRCLVTDFGIARTAEASSLTATGMMIGTPAYLAPEQVTGEGSDHRADIYALGVMAYEMVVGKQPFEAPTPTAVLMKRLGPPPDPVGKARANVPKDLEDAISGCLAPDPAERFQTANDVVQALGVHDAGSRTTAEFVLKSRRQKTNRGVGIAVGVVVLAAAGFLGMRAMKGANRDNASTTTAAVTPMVAKPPLDADMVLVAAGSYPIGTDTGFAKARPAHTVSLAAFGIEQHEVTVGDYKAFADSTKSPVPWSGAMPDAALPVTRVQWAEATNYCRWKHPDGGDLPSEEQWEAAARGVSGRKFPWGDAYDLAAANTAAARRNGPAPVGTFSRGNTPEGIQDLIGNVWEWTRSPMRAYPGGAAFPESLATYYVIRGGAYNAVEAIASPWFRGYNRPATTRDELSFTGFRCVMPKR